MDARSLETSSNSSSADRSKYFVRRPVSDLWIWWTLVSVAAYVLSELSHLVASNTLLVSTLLSILTTAATLYLLGHYLSNFNWLGWLVATIVGALIGLVIGAIGGGLVYAAIQDATHQNSISDNMVSAIGFFGVIDVIVTVTIAIGQWRVLVDYSSWQRRGFWLRANLISGIISGPLFGAREYLGTSSSVGVALGMIDVILTSLITGYALMQVLQKNSPRSAKSGNAG